MNNNNNNNNNDFTIPQPCLLYNPYRPNTVIYYNTVSYKEQFLIKLASTKNVTFNVSCIKKNFSIGSSFFNTVEKVRQPNIQSSRLPRDLKFIYN
jgi:hypothetical protein